MSIRGRRRRRGDPRPPAYRERPLDLSPFGTSGLSKTCAALACCGANPRKFLRII